MPTKTTIQSVLLALAVITAVSMTPEFIRYMKIRSM
jgi:hypothetical protein